MCNFQFCKKKVYRTTFDVCAGILVGNAGYFLLYKSTAICADVYLFPTNGFPNAMIGGCIRKTCVDRGLDRISRGLNTKLTVHIAEGRGSCYKLHGKNCCKYPTCADLPV